MGVIDDDDGRRTFSVPGFVDGLGLGVPPPTSEGAGDAAAEARWWALCPVLRFLAGGGCAGAVVKGDSERGGEEPPASIVGGGLESVQRDVELEV